MRLIPSLPLAPLGAAVAAAVLLSGCEGGDFEFDTDFLSGEESPGPSESPSPEDGENSEGEDGQDQEQASGYALPQSCEAADVAGAAGDLAPGTELREESGEIEDIDGAEQVSCILSSGEAGAATLTVVFTEGTDPSANPEVIQVPGAEEEMNWDVDIDVDVDTYHTEDTDDLGGDLEYVGAVDGSSTQLYLELPEEFYVTAVVTNADVEREELERVVLRAAENVRS
ncbi:hypothetical protein [Nocardiopsis kunsanensis]|uniref:hypothetical protein n=1 Tax=Nocardiopsis kunsanensis TaxID=141693 RepID=UPI00034AA161|nr:hypothetical protein [Nocardiopsis kunsanensis]